MEESIKILYSLLEELEKTKDSLDSKGKLEYIVRIQTIKSIIKLFENLSKEIESENSRKNISDTFYHE